MKLTCASLREGFAYCVLRTALGRSVLFGVYLEFVMGGREGGRDLRGWVGWMKK